MGSEHCDWVTALLTGIPILSLRRSRCAADQGMWHAHSRAASERSLSGSIRSSRVARRLYTEYIHLDFVAGGFDGMGRKASGSANVFRWRWAHSTPTWARSAAA